VRAVPSSLATAEADILAEKRRKAKASTKAQGSGKQPTGQSSGQGENGLSQKAPLAATGKRKAKESNSSDFGGSM
jgi:hypothetical protein